MFAGKKRMGQKGRRDRISLYFSSSCLLSCVRIDCQRWYQVYVGVLLSHSWFGSTPVKRALIFFERRERVSLYFSTSCLSSCVRIGCKRWYQVHVGGVFN